MKRFQYILAIVILLATGTTGFAQSKPAGEIVVTDFTAKEQGGNLYINWGTEDAEAVNYFEVQESYDGKQFRPFAIVMGPDPSKAYGEHGFIKKIKKKFKNVTYLRLRHVDKDGKEQLSEIIQSVK